MSAFVVIDIETSMITGSPFVGHAAANGLGVNTARQPPYGPFFETEAERHVAQQLCSDCTEYRLVPDKQYAPLTG